jgi:hypothetical protein
VLVQTDLAPEPVEIQTIHLEQAREHQKDHLEQAREHQKDHLEQAREHQRLELVPPSRKDHPTELVQERQSWDQERSQTDRQ